MRLVVAGIGRRIALHLMSPPGIGYILPGFIEHLVGEAQLTIT